MGGALLRVLGAAALSLGAMTAGAPDARAHAGHSGGHGPVAGAVAAFAEVCLARAPDFEGAAQAFEGRGYHMPAPAAHLRKKPGSGFAGANNACVVYVAEKAPEVVVDALTPLVQEQLRDVTITREADGATYRIGDFAPTLLTVSVRPADEGGAYRGHTLMIVERASP